MPRHHWSAVVVQNLRPGVGQILALGIKCIKYVAINVFHLIVLSLLFWNHKFIFCKCVSHGLVLFCNPSHSITATLVLSHMWLESLHGRDYLGTEQVFKNWRHVVLWSDNGLWHHHEITCKNTVLLNSMSWYVDYLDETHSAASLYSAAGFNLVSILLSCHPLSQSVSPSPIAASHPYLVMPRKSRDDMYSKNVLLDHTRPVANQKQKTRLMVQIAKYVVIWYSYWWNCSPDENAKQCEIDQLWKELKKTKKRNMTNAPYV